MPETLDGLSSLFVITVALAALAAAMPLLLASLGEIVGEQAGVLNLGIEGVMLLGAFSGFIVGYGSGQPLLGYLVALFVGLLASIPMVVAVMLGLNQIVVGLSVYLGGLALTSIAFDTWLAAENPRIAPGATWAPVIPLLLAAVLWWWLSRTRSGLMLRATGLNPRGVDVVGTSVTRVRVGAVLFGGATAGLGGAYLSLQVVGSFTPAMTQGLGFLAIVVAMLARERVWVGILSALLYGVMVSLGTASQLTTVSIPSDVIEMAPFVLVIVVLAFARFRTTGSAVLGNSYIRM